MAKTCGAEHILTSGTDQPVYTAAAVSSRLGLFHPINESQGLWFTHKAHMKKRLLRGGIRTPRTATCRIGSKPEVPFPPPYVVKPSDSQGQRGISLLSANQADGGGLETAIERALAYSRSGSAVVEQFVEGGEVTANCWVSGGRVQFLQVNDRLHFDDQKVLGVCKEHRHPSKLAERPSEMASLEDAVSRIPEAFEIENGPLYAQFVMDRDGQPWLIELGYRVGGGFEAFFIPRMTGFDILGQYYDLVTDRGTSIESVQLNRHDFGSICFLFGKPGKVFHVDATEEFLGSGGITVSPGDRIEELEDATSRIGHFLVLADDVESYHKRLERLEAEVRATDDTGRDLIIRGIYE